MLLAVVVLYICFKGKMFGGIRYDLPAMIQSGGQVPVRSGRGVYFLKNEYPNTSNYWTGQKYTRHQTYLGVCGGRAMRCRGNSRVTTYHPGPGSHVWNRRTQGSWNITIHNKPNGSILQYGDIISIHLNNSKRVLETCGYDQSCRGGRYQVSLSKPQPFGRAWPTERKWKVVLNKTTVGSGAVFQDSSIRLVNMYSGKYGMQYLTTCNIDKYGCGGKKAYNAVTCPPNSGDATHIVSQWNFSRN